MSGEGKTARELLREESARLGAAYQADLRRSRGGWVWEFWRPRLLFLGVVALGLASGLSIKLCTPVSDYQRLNALEARVEALEADR